MSFIDTLLTHDATATVILVDRNSQPGGHWTKAYPFVRLHQASCYYGVNSLPLSKIRDRKGNERFNVHDLATGQEILDYYQVVLKQFRQCGRVQFYFKCDYSRNERGEHIVTNILSGEVTKVTCNKVVAVHSNVVVPSMRGPPFPVDSNVNYAPLNDLPKHIESKKYKQFVVIGAGKTGSDAITYLLRNGIDQSAVTWITSRDVWYFVRDGLWKGYKSYRKDTMKLINPLLKVNTLHEAFLEYEKSGFMARIDPSRRPQVFKGPTIDKEELAGFRSIKHIVRMGRVTQITDNIIILEKGNIPLHNPAETLIVDAMADLDGTFYGYSNFPADYQVFKDDQINIGPALIVYNVSCSAAIIAYIESTFADNQEMKNSMLYFGRGDYCKAEEESYFNQFYCQCKTLKAISGYAPAANFVVNSRTYLDSPCHHHNGTLGLLWAMFGPSQLAKKADKFVEKVENGSYADCKDCFGWAGRQLPEPKELKVKEKSKVKSNYPHGNKSTKFRCCASADVVEDVTKGASVQEYDDSDTISEHDSGVANDSFKNCDDNSTEAIELQVAKST